MKKIYLLFSGMFLFFLMGFSQTRLFKGRLQGIQEVPANASTGFGVLIAQLNTQTNEFVLVADYQGLSANITASHIHIAAPGANAGVAFNITHTGGTSGVLSASTVLTDPQEASLLAGNFYANVHTSTFPGGEMRAQLVEATTNQSVIFTTAMAGNQEVPPNGSTGTGLLTALLDKGTDSIYVTAHFTGLGANSTAAHLHNAPVGSNGPVLVGLNFTTGTTASPMSVAAPFSTDNQTLLVTGSVYVNVHSTALPGGEIRGQLAPVPLPQFYFFQGTLQGSQEVPATPSAAFGVVLAHYDAYSNQFRLTADYQNLSAPVTASHIHQAAAGVNGGVQFNLTNTGLITGALSASVTLTDDQEAALLAGNFYANVHTSIYPGGEIRAQLNALPTETTLALGASLSGAQEVPANASPGTGLVGVLFNKATRNIYVTGNFSGLVAPSTAGHLHRGAFGVNGNVMLGLNFTTGLPIGVYSATGTLSVEDQALLESGSVYINIHSSTYPGGEIRGQLGASNPLPVKLLAFNAFRKKEEVALTWKTTNETDITAFIVEQWQDDGSWLARGTVLAKGGTEENSYQFLDQPTLKNQRLAYRLKMTGIDGKLQYSFTVTLAGKAGSPILQILQNPLGAGKLRFQITGLENQAAGMAIITDMAGRRMANLPNLKPGINEIDWSGMPRGLYKLSVIIQDQRLEKSFMW